MRPTKVKRKGVKVQRITTSEKKNIIKDPWLNSHFYLFIKIVFPVGIF